jgi:hypothetical protein
VLKKGQCCKEKDAFAFLVSQHAKEQHKKIIKDDNNDEMMLILTPEG